MQLFDPIKTFKKATLPNGLTIWHSQHEKPFYYAYFCVFAGSREDFKGKEGIAHFVEHLVSRNSDKYPRYTENKNFFRDVGGWAMFGETNRLITRYAFMLPGDRAIVEKGFDIFGSMLVPEKFTRGLEDQKKVIQEEYGRKFPDEKMDYLDRIPFKVILNPDHRYAHSTTLGTRQTIAAMTYEDAQKYYDEYYVPQNMAIITAGPASLDEIVEMIEKTDFALEKTGTATHLPSPYTRHKPSESSRTESVSKHFSIKTPHTAYERYWIMPPDNYYAQTLLCNTLSHILMEEIREKRSLAYGFSCGYSNLQDMFMVTIEGQISAEKADEVDSIVKKILSDRELLKVEFEKAKNRKLKSFWTYDSKVGDYVAMAAAEMEVFRRLISQEEYYENYSKTNWSDIEKVLDLMTIENSFLYLVTP